ncbi:fibropellin-3-like, partial [Haliotis rubra]|uniref:fibropellin-3-like n=1 Tax=Haliotis rubra TaxID=36100 RepID=UPI001EE5EBDB
MKSIFSEPTCSQPCENGGTCVSGSCQCLSGYTGSFCESREPTCSQPCENGGTCVSGSCQCLSGYTGSFCESR